MYTRGMTEEWRPVVGHEGFYEVSDQGRVRSLDRIIQGRLVRPHRVKGRVLKASPTNGRPMVHLCENGTKTGRQVGPLVLEAFVGQKPPGQQCCHWDDDPTNNRLENLRWGTPIQNAADRLRNARGQASKTKCPRNHDLFPPNLIKRNARGCLACSSANKWRIRHGLSLDDPRWLAEADRRYAEIMAGTSPIAYNKRTKCPRDHDLKPPNLVTTATVRLCLACRRTRNWGYSRSIPNSDPRWKAEADQWYAAIMTGDKRIVIKRAREVSARRTKTICKRGHKLSGPNAFQQKRGKGCKACALTRSWAHYYGILSTDPRWLAEANRRYSEIMSDAA